MSLRFGAVQALTDVSVAVREREILAIIGPNGAGKTSLLNCINGVYRPQQGRISFAGAPRGAEGVAGRDRAAGDRPHLPERSPVPRHDDARQHHDRAQREDFGRGLFCPGAVLGPLPQGGAGSHRRAVEEIIDFLEIQDIRKTPVGRLPYGLQKRVELGRALAAEPRLLLLDEPMAGMNVEEKEDMSRFVLDVNDEFGTAIVLIEHDMSVVMDISDRVAVARLRAGDRRRRRRTRCGGTRR